MKSWYLSSFLVVLSLILVFVLAPASILLQPLTSNIAFASANISNLTRIVPPGALCPNTTFNVTVNWTINATGVNSLVLTDYAPAGWSLSGNNSWSQPNSSNYSIVGGRIEIIWTLSPNVSDKFSAVYQATVPANATPGNYSFVNGTLDYYVNITPCTDTIANSTVTVTAYSLTVTSDGCCPIDVSGAVNDTIPAGGNATYPDLACGAVVTVSADDSDPCCVFDSWSDAGNQTHDITMDADKDVTATCTALGPFNLTVTSDGCCPIDVSGAVNGTVGAGQSQNFSVDCGGVVTLNATATGNCTFNNWTVDGNFTPGNPINVTMNSAHTAVANCTEAAPAENATFIGNMTFPEAAGPRWAGRVMNVSFYDNSSKAWQFSRNATTNETGYFTVPDVTPGTWDVLATNCSDLTQLNASRTFTAGEPTGADFGASREGDCNGDDWVTLDDRTLLYEGWGSKAGQSGYNICYDLNRDGWLTLDDRTLMYENWGQSGDRVKYKY